MTISPLFTCLAGVLFLRAFRVIEKGCLANISPKTCEITSVSMRREDHNRDVPMTTITVSNEE